MVIRKMFCEFELNNFRQGIAVALKSVSANSKDAMEEFKDEIRLVR